LRVFYEKNRGRERARVVDFRRDAQSSVSLYGIIDEGFEAISNAPVAASNGGGRLFRLDANNGLNGSRWA
jgi:predicted porin